MECDSAGSTCGFYGSGGVIRICSRSIIRPANQEIRVQLERGDIIGMTGKQGYCLGLRLSALYAPVGLSSPCLCASRALASIVGGSGPP